MESTMKEDVKKRFQNGDLTVDELIDGYVQAQRLKAIVNIPEAHLEAED